MAGRRKIAAVAFVIAALLIGGGPGAAGASAPDPGADAVAAAKKKCKKKKGVPKKKRKCKRKRKLIGSTVTISCPAGPLLNGTPATISGVLSPDPKGNSPLGAIWATPGYPEDSLSFFTSPGGSFSFTFTPPGPGTTTVRVDFAGDTLFADRRQSSAACSFAVLAAP